MRSVKDGERIEKSEFVYFHIGAGAFVHNYVCAVCFKESAVLNTGPFPSYLAPCWQCYGEGYRLIKRDWFDKLFRRFL